jgi:cytochrome c556
MPIHTVLVLLGVSASVFAADDVISQRKALMKANGAAAKTASEFINGSKPYDAAAAAEAMKTIVKDMETFVTLFPDGSDQGNTSASPAIWEKMDAFKAANAKMIADANAAADAAAQGVEAFKTAFNTVGGNCQSCHQEFRIRR